MIEPVRRNGRHVFPLHKQLTPFGLRLWRAWPFPVRERIGPSAEAYTGLRTPRGVMWAGVLTDCYHGYWPRLGLLYWRRSFWLFGWRIAEWHRISVSARGRAIA